MNEELAQIFIRLDLMEQTGSGIPLVIEHYGKNVFEFLDFFLRVTIPFAFEIENEDSEDFPKASQRLPKEIPKVAQKTFEAICSDPYATLAELGLKVGVSDRSIKTHIALLKKGKIIRRVGGKTHGHWKIISQDEDSK